MAADNEAQLIEAIYDAALDPVILDDVLARMRARVNASANVCFATSPAGPEPWHLHVFDQSIFAIYAAHYHDKDIYIEGALARGLMRPGAVLPDQVLVDATTVHRSALVNELLYPNDFGPVCSSPVHMTRNGMVALTFLRSRCAEGFDRQDVALLQAMMPHFGRAARLRLRLQQHARPPAWTLELLDTLPWGLILLDSVQRAVVVNREAERILAQRDGLQLDRRGLFADHPEHSHRLRTALCQATASCNGHAGPGADLQLIRPSGAPALLLTIVPLGRRVLDHMGTCSLRAAVHIVDPATRPVATAERLRIFFGLTPAEAALTQALAAGKSLQEYADEAKVTSETARWRLKQVLAKTDTHRQAELVRLLLSSVVPG